MKGKTLVARFAIGKTAGVRACVRACVPVVECVGVCVRARIRHFLFPFPIMLRERTNDRFFSFYLVDFALKAFWSALNNF